jgi:hypothetical protein
MSLEEVRYHSFVLLWSKCTGRVDKCSTTGEMCIREGEEALLESRLPRYVIQRPESITLLMLYVYSSLSRTRGIDEDTIELGARRIEIVASISLLPLYDRRSLELTVMHETIISDLVLLDRGDESSILHEHGELSRLGSWSRTDVEYHLTWLRVECEDGEHGCDTLEVDLPIVERASSLDRVFMSTIERIGSVESCEGSYYDSFFTEFGEDISPVSQERVDTQGADSFMRKRLEYSIIVSSEERLES